MDLKKFGRHGDLAKLGDGEDLSTREVTCKAFWWSMTRRVMQGTNPQAVR